MRARVQSVSSIAIYTCKQSTTIATLIQPEDRFDLADSTTPICLYHSLLCDSVDILRVVQQLNFVAGPDADPTEGMMKE